LKYQRVDLSNPNEVSLYIAREEHERFFQSKSPSRQSFIAKAKNIVVVHSVAFVQME
jgi:hypothetical protein